MSGELDRLLIRLEADTAQLRRAMAEAEKSVDGYTQKADKALARAEARFKKMGAAVTQDLRRALGAYAGFQGVNLAGGLVRDAAALERLAEAAGLTTARYQELRYAAAQAGMTHEDFDRAAAKFAENMARLRVNSGEFYQFLKDHLPTVAAQLQATNSQAEAFDVLADTLQRLGGDADRLALVRRAAGETGDEFARAGKNGAAGFRQAGQEAHRLGHILDTEMIGKAAEAEREWKKAAGSLEANLKRAFVNAIPYLDKLVQGINHVLETADKHYAEVNAQLAARGQAHPSYGANRANLRQKQSEIADLERTLADRQKPGLFSGAARDFGRTFGDSDEEIARKIDALRDEASELTRLDAALNRRARAEEPAPAKGGPNLNLDDKPVTAGGKTADDVMDDLRRELAASRDDRLAEIDAQEEAEIKSFRRMVDQKAMNDKEFAEARLLLHEVTAAKVAEYHKEEAESARAAVAELESAVHGSLSGAFDELFDTGKLDMEEFFRSFLVNIAKAQVEMRLLKPIMDSLFGAAGTQGGAGGAGGLLGSLIGAGAGVVGGMIGGTTSVMPGTAANGGWTTTVSTPGLAGFRATGGPVTAGKSYVVGEEGPEVFVPPVSGHIVPNHELGSAPDLERAVASFEAHGRARAKGGPVTAGVPYLVGEAGLEQYVPNVAGAMARGAPPTAPGSGRQADGAAGATTVYNIDARGADISVVKRLEAALAAAQQAQRDPVDAVAAHRRRFPTRAA